MLNCNLQHGELHKAYFSAVPTWWFWTLQDRRSTWMCLHHIPQTHLYYLYYPGFPVFPDILGFCYPYWILPDITEYSVRMCLRKLSDLVNGWVLVIIITKPKPCDRPNSLYRMHWLPVSSIFRLLREEGLVAPSYFVTESVYYALGQEKLVTADNVYKTLLFPVLSICIIALTFLFTPPMHCKA